MVPDWENINIQTIKPEEILSLKKKISSLKFYLPYYGLKFDSEKLLDYYINRAIKSIQQGEAFASIFLMNKDVVGFQVCAKVNYLSDYFGINCGSISITGLSPNTELQPIVAQKLFHKSLAEMKARGIEFVSANVYPSEKATIYALEECGFHLVEIFTNYTQDISTVEFPANPKEFVIRDCKASDIEQIKNLYKNETFPGRLIAEQKFPKERSYALYGQRFQEVFEKNIGRIFIADRDGQVIGALIGIIDNGLFNSTGIKINVLSGMGIIVDRKHRGMGIATQLISERMRWYQSEGVQKVSFGASIENIPMIRGLANLGMKFTSALCVYHAWP